MNENVSNENKKRSRGYIYWNTGKKMLVRLAVSLYTLRQVTDDSVTIICDEDSWTECSKIATQFNAYAKPVTFEKTSKNFAYFGKCQLHKITPYDTSIFLDGDTIIYKSIPELYYLAEKYEYVATQFVDWTTNNNRIRKRIGQWKPYFPDMMQGALAPQPAINGGVFAFTKDSKLMKDWYSYAKKGINTFIPDETSCQMILHKYPHYIVSPDYNVSCKYGKITDDTKVIHFHGRKHSRIDDKGNYIYNSKLWYDVLTKISDLSIVRDNIKFDKQLPKYLEFKENKWIKQLLQQ